VREVEGVWCFVFVEDKKVGRRLKSATAVRTVPVHPKLCEIGWLHYVDTVRRSGGGWLFPEISPELPSALKAWTKWFTRYLRKAGVEDERKVFHSLRHTFKDALRAANVGEDLNDALCGQKNSTVGRSYGAKQRSGAKDIVRRFGMLRLKAAIHAVEFDGLRFPYVKQNRNIARLKDVGLGN
jgi:integrase